MPEIQDEPDRIGARGGEIFGCYGAGLVKHVSTLQVGWCRHFCQAEVEYLDVPALLAESVHAGTTLSIFAVESAAFNQSLPRLIYLVHGRPLKLPFPDF
jgi:hypothetical protein